MPYGKTTVYGESMNILESEVGLVTKTREANASLATTVGSKKIIKAGTLWSVTESESVVERGIVLQDYDVTDYTDNKYPIAVIFQGRVWKDLCSSAAQSAASDFAGQGLYLI